ncbi:MAG: hypothetical protein LBE69_16295, partial [Klebsiella sp.]|nr:hypothetical protein [Klebsiella sp.]
MMTKTKADKYPQRVRNELRFRELTVLRVERAGAGHSSGASSAGADGGGGG